MVRCVGAVMVVAGVADVWWWVIGKTRGSLYTDQTKRKKNSVRIERAHRRRREGKEGKSQTSILGYHCETNFSGR
ncbi:hypothetical protein P8452_44906 [Trifolium repens]|nr:hypothetical protein P8452_44906 [Trifolium repens]